MKTIASLLPATLLLLAAPLAADITFDASFESGNGTGFVQTGPNAFDFEIEPDTNSSDRQWFYFAVNGAEGQVLTLRLLNTDDTNVTGHWNDARPVFSTDSGANWAHTTGPIDRGTTTWSFTHEFTAESERVAFHFPYTVTMLEEKLPQWTSHAMVKSEVLGESAQGRPITYLRVTDSRVPDDDKLAIWVIARQHAAEVTGSFTMEGFVDFLLSEKSQAEALRAGAILHVVPMVNPDGVAAGNYRDNFQGVNLNRVWDGSADADNGPEVRLVQDKLDATVAQGDGRYVFFLDLHSTSGRGPHFAFHPVTQQPPLYPTPESYGDDTRRYLMMVNSYTPWFSATRGASTGDDQRLAYHRQRNQYGVLALTPEGVYTRMEIGPNPDGYQTPTTHRGVGEGFARSLAEYYDLKPPVAGDAWLIP